MGEIRNPRPVKLFIAVLYEERNILEDILPQFEKRWREIEWISEEIPFTYTDYYQNIGENLKRVFIVFKPLIDPGELADIKVATNEIEKTTQEGKKERRINLDPGYFDGGKIVLASTKNFSHRVYLCRGIYAEATIKWEKGDFRPFPYTYPDYQSPEYRPSLRKIRELYQKSLHQKDVDNKD